MALPVAVQLYSVRDDVKADMKGTLKKIKEMGYAGVEFAGLFDYAPADVKAWCDEIGLTPISAHVPIDELINDLEGSVKKYNEIGVKFIVIPYVIEERRPGGAKFAETLEYMKKIGAECNKYGIIQLYHNHDFEFVKLDGKYGLDVIYDTVPADLLKTELDTCWVNVGGENPANYVIKYTDRAPVVHLKDFAGEKSDDMYELIGIEKKAPTRPGNFEFRPVGSGVQNFPEILKASEESGATWVVVEQDQPTMGLNPIESIKKSREYLKTLGY